MLTRGITRLFMVMICLTLFTKMKSQTLQVTANFVQPDIPVTIHPENPGICDPLQGVEVTVIEDFESYIWTSPGHPTLDGKTVKIHFSGEWTINVGYVLNGVLCYKEIKIYVYDLKNPAHIKKYFVDQDFWPVTIYKVAVEPSEPPLACRNCTCSDQLEEVGFDPGIAFMKLTENVELFEEFIPFQDLDYHKSITNNNCLCNTEGGSALPEFEAAMQNGDMALWGHQFFLSPAESQGTLYLKGRMSWQEESPVGAHRFRMGQIKSGILSYNAASTAQQAKVLFTNLFMTNPIGGYEFQSECDYSHLIASESIILTPTAVPLQVSNSLSNLNFVTINDENAEFEGSLKSFEIGLKNYHGYVYRKNKFAGYFHEISGEVIEDFSISVNNLACRNCLIKLPIICNSECTVYDFNSEEQYPSSPSGGIGFEIMNKNSVPGVTCFDIGCGKFAGDKEIEDLINSGVNLTNEDKISLRDFFSVMYCEDKEIFDCFREGQLNPGSSIDLFLEDVKTKLLSSPNALLDGCDDLSPYVDRWTQLAAFNPNTVSSVKTRLEQLGDEYWLQTLENAHEKILWWKTAPSVNMDFFGLKITNLPNKPYPPFNQFTHTEFLEYIRRNWTSSSIFGEGNICKSSIPFVDQYFEYAYPQDAFIWTGNNGISTIFTIKMPDDGSVICSQHNSGDYWVFSTLNAPGWLMADNEPGLNSWDGYHPVSGNRQFGILNNNDGSFTFYTSGVDRLSGWWHATAGPIMGLTPLGSPFEQADKLWTCFLNNVKLFIELNGGTTNVQFDCTTVRPKWSELRNAIKKGCEGLSSSITKFPCKQSKSCE